MARKKVEKPVFVKNPKIGQSYYFRFAGSILHGKLLRKDEDLSRVYSYPWFFLEDLDGWKYPTSLDKISKKKSDLEFKGRKIV